MHARVLMISALRSLLALGRSDTKACALLQCAQVATGNSSSAATIAAMPYVWLPAPLPARSAGQLCSERTQLSAAQAAPHMGASPGCPATAYQVLNRQCGTAFCQSLPSAAEPQVLQAKPQSALSQAQTFWRRRAPLTAAHERPAQPPTLACAVGARGQRRFATRPAAQLLPPPPSPPKGSGIDGVKHIVAVASGKGGVGKSTTAGDAQHVSADTPALRLCIFTRLV